MQKQVLVIDDDPLYLDLVMDILSPKDIKIQAAQKATEALAFLKTYTPSFILSDFDMPDMNGIELHTHLKKNEETNKIPFAFLTGSADPTVSLYAQQHNLKVFRKADIVNELLRFSEHLAKF